MELLRSRTLDVVSSGESVVGGSLAGNSSRSVTNRFSHSTEVKERLAIDRQKSSTFLRASLLIYIYVSLSATGSYLTMSDAVIGHRQRGAMWVSLGMLRGDMAAHFHQRG